MAGISLEAFVTELHDDVRTHPRCGHVFFLGAGCSISSGIPAAGRLTSQWVEKLERMHRKAAQELVPGYDPDNPAASYGPVIHRRFPSAELRQEEIERICKGKIPGFGYVMLAMLMTDERYRDDFGAVITTNFDDLVADAFHFNTTTRPLIIGHPALAPYVKPYQQTPTILKAHGDLRLEPLNTSDETLELTKEMRGAFATLAGHRSLIFVGYGGNDPGVATALSALSPPPRWVCWVNVDPPGAALRPFVEKQQAHMWVEHRDFDDLMLAIQHKFELPHPHRDRFGKVIDAYEGSVLRAVRAHIAVPPGGAVDLYRHSLEHAQEAGYFHVSSSRRPEYDRLEAEREDARCQSEFERTLDPNHVLHRANLAHEYGLGDPALILLDALSKLPRSVILNLELARVASRAEQEELSLSHYDAVLVVDPDHTDARKERDDLLRKIAKRNATDDGGLDP